MKTDLRHDFTAAELRRLRALKTPYGVQRFLSDMPYHLANSSWSPRRVLRERTAHCLEGAIFAAAALRVLGFPPLVVDLEAERDTDHVIAVFRDRGHWGAIAASNYATCRYREPVYRSLRELALSYFDGYYNLAGERSLRTFSRPVDLSRFDARHWMTAEKDVWFIAEHLCEIPHTRLLSKAQAKRLHRVDARGFASGLVGHATKREPRPRLPWPKGFRPRG
ncbi:MAG TPA: hypothetical protein VMV18_00700 [bacterium]|nr:hypothetical protein [bacterium]